MYSTQLTTEVIERFAARLHAYCLIDMSRRHGSPRISLSACFTQIAHRRSLPISVAARAPHRGMNPACVSACSGLS